jgi:hypothetical protein
MSKGRAMSKLVILAAVVTCILVSSSWLRAMQPAPGQCLHGSSEQSNDRIRRDQALRLVEQINRAESLDVSAPRYRRYRPLDQLGNLPSTPAGFRLQFLIDGSTYSVSLKDTRDACNFAIFSDQDQMIYQATARGGNARVVPADIP